MIIGEGRNVTVDVDGSKYYDVQVEYYTHEDDEEYDAYSIDPSGKKSCD